MMRKGAGHASARPTDRKAVMRRVLALGRRRTGVSPAGWKAKTTPVLNAGQVFAFPALLLVGIVSLYSYGYALWASMHSVSPIFPLRFTGLLNLRLVIASPYFLRALSNTLLFTALSVPVIVVLGIAVASLLNQRFRGRSFVRLAVLLPWTVPAVIAGVIWRGMFSDTWGAINAVLYQAHLISNYVEWLSQPALAVGALVVAHVWTQSPLAAILTLAAMQAIPAELYEAADIDGASPMQMFLHITFPMILPMVIIVTLYELLVTVATFDITYALTGGGPGTATTLLGYFIWSESFKMLNFGRGSALGVIIAGGSLLFIIPLMRLMPRGALMED